MIPLCLVTGFLGSGKTTLLRRFVERFRGRPVAFLVNDFAAVDVDGRLLDLPAGELVSIPGGSIFCRCLSGEFVRHLREIADRRPEGLIVEASGVADPRVIRDMLAETQLDARYELRSVVTVIDPGSFLALIHTLPAIIAQVESCQVALINKVDLYDEARVKESRYRVGRLNPLAEVVLTTRCRADVDPFAALAPDELHGQYAACADPNFVTHTVELKQPVDLDWLLGELRRLQRDLYRAKGFIPTADGMVHVDLSAGGLTVQPLPRVD